MNVPRANPGTAGGWKLDPAVWLDGRRAAWLPQERALAVADLHFGRAWSARRRGALVPVNTPDDTADRLAALQSDYAPHTIVFLGDLIHETVAVADVAEGLRCMLGALARRSRLVLTRGNHDRQLVARQERLGLPLEIVETARLGPHVGVHGDGPDPGHGQDGWLLMGHEHPCVTLGDGVGTAMRCPCFVAGQRRLILPAFSDWAAGCEVGRRPFLSTLGREHRWELLVAIVGTRCLPLA